MATKHESTVRDILVADGYTNVYMGPVRDGRSIDDESIFVSPDGGQAPQAYVNASVEGAYKRAGIQVRIRGNPNSYADIRQKALDIWTLLERNEPASYVTIRCDQSDALYLGQDDQKRHEFSINLTMHIVE